MTEAKPKRPQPPGGSRRGKPNKTTATLKEAILLAAEQVGEDFKGKDGLTGYLRGLAVSEPKAFASLLGRVLPLTLQGPGPNGEHEARVIVEFVRSGS
jgi:hypothetical protein